MAIKTVGIKELKNNLSAYLREVRRGTRILVSDRADVVAELREPGARYASESSLDPVVTAWVERGQVTLPSRGKQALPTSPVRMEAGTANRLLEEDRGERGE